MYYELWNVDSGNIVASFDSEAAALESVRKMVDAYGDASVDDWSLIPRDALGYGETIAYGRDLLKRAREMTAA